MTTALTVDRAYQYVSLSGCCVYTYATGQYFFVGKTPHKFDIASGTIMQVSDIPRINLFEPERTQPRNSPCRCGSGKKAKRCCVYFLSEP